MTTSQTTQALVDMLVHRDQQGQKKYGTSLDRADLLPEDWAQHAIEEALDMAGYLARFGATIAELRAENERLRGENVRMRAMLAPILELARTLDIEPSTPAMPVVVEVDVVEVDVVEDSVHNILTDDKMLCPVPSVSETLGLTSREIAQALGYHKDSVNNWGRAGLLPEPVAGTGAHPHNPARYVVDLTELRTKVEARQAAAVKSSTAKIQPIQPIQPVTPLVAKPVRGLTRKQLAERLGCDDTSIGNYEKRGLIAPIEGTGTGLKNPRLYRASDIPALRAKIAELHAKKGAVISKVLTESRAKAITPKDEEIETPEIIVEPRPAPQLSEATKHDYHWRNALPVLESAIETADAAGEVALEVAYQTTPGNYEQRGSFVVRPFGQPRPGLIAFVRATKESGKWSVTIPLRVESWIKPMAEGLRDYWRDQAKVQDIAEYRRSLSSDSPTRSLQA